MALVGGYESSDSEDEALNKGPDVSTQASAGSKADAREVAPARAATPSPESEHDAKDVAPARAATPSPEREDDARDVAPARAATPSPDGEDDGKDVAPARAATPSPERDDARNLAPARAATPSPDGEDDARDVAPDMAATPSPDGENESRNLGVAVSAMDSASFEDVVDAYIAKASADGGEGPPTEYKAQILEIYENAPPEGKEQMLANMRDMVQDQASQHKDEEEMDQDDMDQDIRQTRSSGAALADLDVPMSFSEVVDMYIAHSVASGDGGPPPEYKAQILEIYESAPPEGQEQMLADMRDMVRKEALSARAEEQEKKAEAAHPKRSESVGQANQTAATLAGELGKGSDLDGAQMIQTSETQSEQAQLQMSEADVPKNPLVFFEIGVDGASIGHIEFELFADVVPKTAENFRCLCTGEKGRSEMSKCRLTYFESTFHRIIPGFMCQGGDFTRENGTGGESIYGEKFKDENFKRKHAKGSLSMANSGPNTNGSQFFICTGSPSHLNGKHVVFGEVVAGYDVVEKMEALGSKSGRTKKKVTVLNCGMVNLEDSQAPKRPKLAIDVAPAPRLISETPVEEGVPGGLLGLLEAKDKALAEGGAEGGPAEPETNGSQQLVQEQDAARVRPAPVARTPARVPAPAPKESEEVHILHILRKHIGSRKPKSRSGAPITCSQQEAEEYLEEIGMQLLCADPAELPKQFMDLARTESDCASGKKGGDVGRFRRGQREGPFEDAAFALKVGEMSDLISTDSGVHILLRVP